MISEKLAQLGIVLPEANVPLASYMPAKLEGTQIWVSGQLPLRNGELLLTGPLYNNSAVESAQQAMRQCFLNGLVAASSVARLDQLAGVLQLGAYVASGPDFYEQHLVANGASNLAQEIFGDSGRHSRFAVGVSALPLNASVELSVVFQIEGKD